MLTPNSTEQASWDATRTTIALTPATATPNRTPRPLDQFPTPPTTPTLMPSSYISLNGNGFIASEHDSFVPWDRSIQYKNSWRFDQGNVRIIVTAGAIIFAGSERRERLPEPHQGMLVIERWTYQPWEDPKGSRERYVELPVRDGVAQIVDARVQGEQMLLTVKTTGGSVYVYDVLQRTLTQPQPPTLDAGGPYAVAPGGDVKLVAQGHDAAGVLLEYSWDLDGDGSFERDGRQPTFHTQGLPDGTRRTVTARVTSKSGLSATATALVQVQAQAPTAAP